MKKLLKIIIVIVICLFVLSILRDYIIKLAISAVVTEITGTKVSIDRFSLSLFKQSAYISNLRMYNPPGFSKSIMVDLPKLDIDYDLASLLRGRLHLPFLGVELREITLEKNKEGRLNVDSLKVVQVKQTPKKPHKALKMQIDILNIQMGKLVSTDYRLGPQPKVKVHEINLKKSYKNITSAEQLIVLILSEPMKAAGITAAEIYGLALFTGVGVIPIAIVSTFAGKDSVQQNFDFEISRVYSVTYEVIKQIGKITREDKTGNIITADVQGASIVARLKRISNKSTQITISARKYILPKREIADGILYRITEKLR